MRQINLSELGFHNIGCWPFFIRMIVILMLCLFLFALGYWYDLQQQMILLENSKAEEKKLRKEFIAKQYQAANFDIYQKQHAEIQKLLRDRLSQLAKQTKHSELFDAISERAIASGLEFRLIKPMPVSGQDFYMRFPIYMVVTGNYHAFAKFVSELSKLPHIVTVADFTMQPLIANKQQSSITHNELTMELMVETIHDAGMD
jgi:type IV pilus assembly protein PilO